MRDHKCTGRFRIELSGIKISIEKPIGRSGENLFEFKQISATSPVAFLSTLLYTEVFFGTPRLVYDPAFA